MITQSAEKTLEAGREFALKLKGGEVVALIGDLGSGKTTFTKGLAEGLKVVEVITSPTFVILKPYEGKIRGEKITLVHVDAYRLETPEDINSVGLKDYFNKDSVVVIEWAEKIKKLLPKNTIYINFKHLDLDSREIFPL